MAGISLNRPGLVLASSLVACLIASTGLASAAPSLKSSASDNEGRKPGDQNLPESIRTVRHDHPSRGGDKQKIANEVPMTAPVNPSQDPMPKPSPKLLSATTETIVKASPTFVWQQLTDFTGYPTVFPRIESCKILKHQGSYVYTESNLRPQLFLKETRQKIINDLTGKPHVFRWAMLEGGFSSSQGCWELSPDPTGKFCKVKYTLEATPEAVPKSIATVTLKFIQKDIVKTFKRVVEKQYMTRSGQSGNVAINQ
jgi:ribosome-associated toxin RatA of RatAB toxin-antitoxin module